MQSCIINGAIRDGCCIAHPSLCTAHSIVRTFCQPSQEVAAQQQTAVTTAAAVAVAASTAASVATSVAVTTSVSVLVTQVGAACTGGRQICLGAYLRPGSWFA